jgi:hypothetical protein
MPRTEKYFIGPGLLSDIRQTITRVAGMPDRTSGVKTQVVHQEMMRRGGRGGEIKIINFTGSWSKMQPKTVAIDPTTTTMTVVNVFASISNSSCSRKGAAAKVDDTWYLISAEGG